ncbi:Aldehyde/histidinol dehydrogenase [Mycotypha africana]|uniref:Aldehyde/histidinol dehydrogenase n=1 Tax=Mycotypha africana TaxID=64632 RepID=UPI002300278A|nr:Aldehyde/histidinol dehydrogenase [Mycotypha africana]KAI8979077.1 Aldehyde/histidinol dehydrogenase [Mycotypha africana]
MTSLLNYTSLDSIQDNVSHVRQVFHMGKPRDMYWRKYQLQRLYDMISENEKKLCDAMKKDMNKPLNEAMSGDIAPVLDECLYFLDQLDDLAKDIKVKPRSGLNKMEKVVIRRDPLGVVLILGSWNYPVQLSLVPFAGAIAAGNAVILKLSEVSPHTAAVITELFPKYMDTSCYRLVNGGVEETTALLKEKFDHIFYTGNSNVAKIVMTAAAQHLTPVTLELGGKSPAVILPDANMQLTANRIAFGKLYNAGQICIAVDYVLCPASRLSEFVSAFKKTLHDWYKNDPQKTDSYARIVNERHFDRLANLLQHRQSGDIAVGGHMDRADRYIAPTLITHVRPDDPVLMGDEIFGPILPVITYNEDVEEAMGVIRKREPPLALYIFTKKPQLAEKILKNTPSGGVCVNDCLMHQAEYGIPFGGVGHSAKSYATFTHERSMLIKKQTMESVMSIRYPPYNQRKYNLLRMVLVKPAFLVALKKYNKPIKALALILVLVGLYLKRQS